MKRLLYCISVILTLFPISITFSQAIELNQRKLALVIGNNDYLIGNLTNPVNDARAIEMLYDMQSRKAMTSGTLTEVPDQSAFTKYLVERLSENQDKYLSSEQLFSSFRIAVINNSDAVPQFGEIRNVGDQGGDFIFIKK